MIYLPPSFSNIFPGLPKPPTTPKPKSAADKAAPKTYTTVDLDQQVRNAKSETERNNIILATKNAPSAKAKGVDGIGEVAATEGGFSQNGKKVNLSTLMMNLMLERVQSVDGVLSGMIGQMNQNNVDTKNMNNFLNSIREIRPAASDGKVKWSKIYDAEQATWKSSGQKAWPHKDWGLNLDVGESMTQSQVDQLIEVMKSKISTVNSNQQMEQIKLEKYNNVRNESMQMVSTMMKSQTQALQGIINNMS